MDISRCGTEGLRFDAYAATVDARSSDLMDAFEGLTEGATWRRVRPSQGYAAAAVLEDVDGQLGRLSWGGSHELPHASFQGHASHQAAGLLRECFSDHALARGDVVVLDTFEPGGYDLLQAQCIRVADDLRVKLGTAGDHLLTHEGRTVYLGAPSSVVRARLYDKRAERLAKLRDPSKRLQLPEAWARLEVQVRPQGAEAKRAAARASPAELAGSARWSRALSLAVVGLELPRFDPSPEWRESDHARAYAAMLGQYKAVLRQVLEDAGSPECMGLQLAHDLAELEAKARRMR